MNKPFGFIKKEKTHMIHFDFSPNNQMVDFETQDSKSTVYLGFASDPKINIFSQKIPWISKHECITETLIKEQDLLDLPKNKDYTVMIHTVKGIPSLDGATAALAIQKNREELESEQWKNLSDYTSEIEKGNTTPPFLVLSTVSILQLVKWSLKKRI